MAMWRYALTAIVAVALVWVGIAAIARGQTTVGIVFIGLATLRTAAFFWSGKPRKPQPSIRLNLDGEANGSGGSEQRSGTSQPPAS
jgi:hypothetical protein